MTKRRFILIAALPATLIALAGLTVWRPSLILHGDILQPIARTWEREWNRQLRIFGVAQAKEQGVRAPQKYRGGRSWKLLSRIARNTPRPAPAAAPAAAAPAFDEDFAGRREILETPAIGMSTSAEWWVNSGSKLEVSSGSGKTVQDRLPLLDYWRLQYALSNPEDTQHGRRPQNIFRMVERRTWGDLQQDMYFRINRLHADDSEHRNASNGVLLLNRYRDGNNLYYTGLRVDGAAVIKKKAQGVYYTLDYRPVFPGTYDRERVPNLLPEETWLGIRSRVTNEADGTVRIQVFLDRYRAGDWELVAEAVDDGVSFGGKALTAPGHTGVRTDFMDVEFDRYAIQTLLPEQFTQ